MNKIIQLIKQDSLRMDALECVYQLRLPYCYLAAGFVRNLVWDDLHQKKCPTPLNDIDVIYFDKHEKDDQVYLKYEAMLKASMPSVNWQVRNQAIMHIRNADRAYTSIVDAMSFWPEKETAVAIRKREDGDYECLSAFGFESLFDFKVTHNPKRQREIFDSRIQSKKWLSHWEKLTLSI